LLLVLCWFVMVVTLLLSYSVLFNDQPTAEIYTLSLHDALPIWKRKSWSDSWSAACAGCWSRRITPVSTRARSTSSSPGKATTASDRKSTRLNSSHVKISYAVLCLKKKMKIHIVFVSAYQGFVQG